MPLYKCQNCNKEFERDFHQGYDENNNVKHYKFCSRNCSNIYNSKLGKNRQVRSKKELINNIKSFLHEIGEYQSRVNICKNVGISNKTLTKYNISIIDVNKECGLRKPKSIFEEKVYNSIKNLKNNLIIEREVSFDTCISPKGFKLRFDFFIRKENLLIEADGNQHYNKNNPNYNPYVNQCDLIKNKWALENNYKLIRIPYTRCKNFDKYIKKFLS